MTIKIPDLTPRQDPKGGDPTSNDDSTRRRRSQPLPITYATPRPNGFFRSNLFIFLMGQIVTFLVGVIFFAIGWGKLSQQFTEGQEWRVQAQARFERMDKEGTNAGRYEGQSARTRLDNIDARLKVVEDEARKIDVMKEKIDRLESVGGVKR